MCASVYEPCAFAKGEDDISLSGLTQCEGADAIDDKSLSGMSGPKGALVIDDISQSVVPRMKYADVIHDISMSVVRHPECAGAVDDKSLSDVPRSTDADVTYDISQSGLTILPCADLVDDKPQVVADRLRVALALTDVQAIKRTQMVIRDAFGITVAEVYANIHEHGRNTGHRPFIRPPQPSTALTVPAPLPCARIRAPLLRRLQAHLSACAWRIHNRIGWWISG